VVVGGACRARGREGAAVHFVEICYGIGAPLPGGELEKWEGAK